MLGFADLAICHGYSLAGGSEDRQSNCLSISFAEIVSIGARIIGDHGGNVVRLEGSHGSGRCERNRFSVGNRAFGIFDCTAQASVDAG